MIHLLPRKTVFFDLFEGLARHVLDSAGHLRELAQSFPNIEESVRQIRRHEHEADEIAHQALDQLDRTFITPFDREDIHMLVGGLDDIVDEIDALGKRFGLFHVSEMDPTFVKQTQVLVDASAALSDAVALLRTTRRLSRFSDLLIEIHRLENVGDDNNHAATYRLFDGQTDPLTVMRWKEIHDRVESAIDACEDVGNTLERITLKNG